MQHEHIYYRLEKDGYGPFQWMVNVLPLVEAEIRFGEFYDGDWIHVMDVTYPKDLLPKGKFVTKSVEQLYKFFSNLRGHKGTGDLVVCSQETASQFYKASARTNGIVSQGVRFKK